MMILALNAKMFKPWLISSEERVANFHLVVYSFANCELRSMVLVDRRSVLLPCVNGMLCFSWVIVLQMVSCTAVTLMIFSTLQYAWIGFP